MKSTELSSELLEGVGFRKCLKNTNAFPKSTARSSMFLGEGIYPLSSTWIQAAQSPSPLLESFSACPKRSLISSCTVVVITGHGDRLNDLTTTQRQALVGWQGRSDGRTGTLRHSSSRDPLLRESGGHKCQQPARSSQTVVRFFPSCSVFGWWLLAVAFSFRLRRLALFLYPSASSKFSTNFVPFP